MSRKKESMNNTLNKEDIDEYPQYPIAQNINTQSSYEKLIRRLNRYYDSGSVKTFVEKLTECINKIYQKSNDWLFFVKTDDLFVKIKHKFNKSEDIDADKNFINVYEFLIHCLYCFYDNKIFIKFTNQNIIKIISDPIKQQEAILNVLYEFLYDIINDIRNNVKRIKNVFQSVGSYNSNNNNSKTSKNNSRRKPKNNHIKNHRNNSSQNNSRKTEQNTHFKKETIETKFKDRYDLFLDEIKEYAKKNKTINVQFEINDNALREEILNIITSTEICKAKYLYDAKCRAIDNICVKKLFNKFDDSLFNGFFKQTLENNRGSEHLTSLHKRNISCIIIKFLEYLNT